MATERQIAANRANAKKSTGPRTGAGNAKVAHSAFRQGLSSKTPEGQAERSAVELAAKLCAEDPNLRPEVTLAFAPPLLRERQVVRALDEMTERAIADSKLEGPYELKADWARLGVLTGRGARLARYRQRAAPRFAKPRRTCEASGQARGPVVFEYVKSAPLYQGGLQRPPPSRRPPGSGSLYGGPRRSLNFPPPPPSGDPRPAAVGMRMPTAPWPRVRTQ